MLHKVIAMNDCGHAVLEMSGGGCRLVKNSGVEELKVGDILAEPVEGWSGLHIEVSSLDRQSVFRLTNFASAADPGQALRELRSASAANKLCVLSPPFCLTAPAKSKTCSRN
jgi:hypothetical protein